MLFEIHCRSRARRRAVLYDYYTSEELLYKNALLTAEGALFEISSAVCDRFSASALRCSDTAGSPPFLQRRLVLLGSRVNVVCRSEKARAAAWADGARLFPSEKAPLSHPKRNARSIPFPHASSGKIFFPQWIFTRRCWSSRHPPASIPPPRKGTG